MPLVPPLRPQHPGTEIRCPHRVLSHLLSCSIRGLHNDCFMLWAFGSAVTRATAGEVTGELHLPRWLGNRQVKNRGCGRLRGRVRNSIPGTGNSSSKGPGAGARLGSRMTWLRPHGPRQVSSHGQGRKGPNLKHRVNRCSSRRNPTEVAAAHLWALRPDTVSLCIPQGAYGCRVQETYSK